MTKKDLLFLADRLEAKADEITNVTTNLKREDANLISGFMATDMTLQGLSEALRETAEQMDEE